jgi:SAM-dependent MidA family methyltransferase
MANPLKEIIEQQLPLSVHDYMQICLQHTEYGYYRSAKAVGAEGDFITAPEISQIFGDLIGFWWKDIWQQMGEPSFHWCELGPGKGTLSADIMRHLKAAKELHLVESNASLRKIQRETLKGKLAYWHDYSESLPKDKPLFIMANEFFDALPIRQWVGEAERHIANDWNYEPAGEVTKENCPAAMEMLELLSERLKNQGGAMLIIDYGYENFTGDSFQAVKSHRYHNPLENPGKADITALVDFAAMQHQVREANLHISTIITQGKFLRSLGGEIWLQKLLLKSKNAAMQKDLQEGWLRLVSPSQMGELFKVLAISSNSNLTFSGF